MIKVMFPLHGRGFFFSSSSLLAHGGSYSDDKNPPPTALAYISIFFFYNYDGEIAVHELAARHSTPSIRQVHRGFKAARKSSFPLK